MGIREAEKLSPKLAGKDSITVRYDGQGHIVEAKNRVRKSFSGSLCGEGMTQRNEVRKLGEFVNDYQNAIVFA
jgi:hypothetical protein